MPDWTLGIDVARWQGVLKMSAVLNARPVDATGKLALDKPVRYVAIKATHGTNPTPDPKFAVNAANSAGVIRRGFYFWFVPTQDPIQQADNFVDITKSFSLPNDLRSWIDFEEDCPPLRGSAIRERFRSCVERVEDRTGRQLTVYTGKYFWQLTCADEDDPWIAGRSLAHAEYRGRVPRDNEAPNIAKPWAIRGIRETFWQFDGDRDLYLPKECGETGSPIDSDFDRFNGDEGELGEFCANGVIPLPRPFDPGTDPNWQPQTSVHTALPSLFPSPEDQPATDPQTPASKSIAPLKR